MRTRSHYVLLSHMASNNGVLNLFAFQVPSPSINLITTALKLWPEESRDRGVFPALAS